MVRYRGQTLSCYGVLSGHMRGLQQYLAPMQQRDAIIRGTKRTEAGRIQR